MGKSESKENGAATEESAPPEVPLESMPTVVPAPDFNVQADTEALNKAFEAFGTNETTITGIIANRSWEQRQEIRDTYQTKFNKTLISEIDSGLSGHYRTALDSMLQDPDTVRTNYVTKIIKDRLLTRLPDSRGKDIALLETIFPLTNAELQGLKTAYQKANGNELFKDIEEKVTGPFKDWVMSLVKNKRNEGVTSQQAIAKDASYLKNLPEDQWTPTNAQLQKLLMANQTVYLLSVFHSYEMETGTKLLEMVEKMDSGIREGFKVIFGSCLDSRGFYADGLYQSMKGLGTNDEKLIYIMIDRCEFGRDVSKFSGQQFVQNVMMTRGHLSLNKNLHTLYSKMFSIHEIQYDLGNIKIAFEIKYKKSLENFIKGDTSGDYKTLLLAVLESKPPAQPATAEKKS